MGFGDGGFDEAEPVLVGFLAAFVGDDFNDFTVLDVMIERGNFSINLSAGHAVADFAVYSIGEVDRCRLFGEFDNISLGSEGEDMVFEKVNLDAFKEFAVVLSDFFLPLLELLDPGKFFGGRCFMTAKEEFAPAGAPLFLGIGPVRGNAQFRFVMHFLCADLDFDNASLWTEDSRVEGLIVVRLREGDIILDAADHGTVTLVDGAESFIAVGDTRHNYANGDEIIDALDIHVMASELLVEPIESFGAALNMNDADAVSGEAFADTSDTPVEV